MPGKTKALEDTWSFNPIGDPFPANPFRVKGEMTNQFVALWYKHGKPTCGRAWNDGGILQCSFPFNGKELSGSKELGGEIQILTYTGDWNVNGYEYNWVKWADRNKDGEDFQLVRCGNMTPALIKCKDDVWRCGQINMDTETASVSYDGKSENLSGGKVVGEMWVVVRNLTDPQRPPPPVDNPFPKCPHSLGKSVPLGDDGWVDLRVKLDAFPDCAVFGLDRPLKQEDGSEQLQAVALWYKHGEPVMGRAWDSGMLAASFGWNDKEFTGDGVGSVQIQCYHSKVEQGFDIAWKKFRDCQKDGWYPVHVRDVAPCVVVNAKGHEKLGKVFIRQEKACVAWAGKEEVLTGPPVQDTWVLCRNPPLRL